MDGIILVTGATGTIGSQVMKSLARKGAKIRAAVHSPGKAEALRSSGAETAVMDYSNPDSVSAALAGVDKAFFLSPLTPAMPEEGARFVELARKAGVKRIVRLSGMGADSEPGITLGRWHRMVERAVESSGIAFTILRPNSFMQNFSNSHSRSIKESGAFYLPCGDGKVSYVDARDIGEAAAAALAGAGNGGRAYALTGPEAISNRDAARIISESAGRDVAYVDIPEQAARDAMRKAGLPEWLVAALLELYSINKAGYTAAVTNGVRELTGREAGTFGKFAADHAGYFRRES